jgi:hypothetical protein
MSKSIRVTITRPDNTVAWPFDTWPDQTLQTFRIMTQNNCDTYIKGLEDDDLTLIVDHFFASNDSYDELRDDAYTIIPIWKTDSNAAEVDAYHTANNITYTVEDITDPDLTDYRQVNDFDYRIPGPR